MQIRYSDPLKKIMLDAPRAWSPDAGSQQVDSIMHCILTERNCHATYMLERFMSGEERGRLATSLADAAAKESAAQAAQGTLCQRMERACEGLFKPGVGGIPVANTGHFLLFALGEEDTLTAQLLAAAGVCAAQVAESLADLPPDEDYYEEMRALEQLSLGQATADTPLQQGKTIENSSGTGEDAEEDDSDGAIPVIYVRSGNASSELEKFGSDLTRAAAEGRIDPVIGRDAEIERLVQILGRRKKNNPVLIGEAGVGKSAVVEGLALRMARGEVPHTLRGKRLFSLDVTSLVAGTKYRGQFEERIKAMMDHVASRGDVVLFIDEIHTIVGAGSTQGGLDTANILKPALARGEVQCIGATTLDEYRESIEKDAALERRFQKILVEPASPAQTLDILRNIRARYEQHHMVRYTDQALAACVELTGRYVTDRFFPDKAIDVLDEAGSRACMARAREPQELKTLQAAIDEAATLRREAVAVQNYGAAANARIREAALRERLGEQSSEWFTQLAANPVKITEEQIGQVITSMTGVPVERVSQGEKQRLCGMAEALTRKVIGQQQAVESVSRAILRSRAGLRDEGKPIGVFMFVGPTGVGKTHLAKELSMWLFDKPEALVRIDMSEYSEKHNVSRLIGSPPGYVGYNEGGQLTEAVRRQPYAVVLFDEIEKAHPDVFNVMLQILDEGQLTDGLGRRVDFRNTVIIMTSNAGSRQVAQRGPAVGFHTHRCGDTAQVNLQADYRRALEGTFAPEFINRIDDIIVFCELAAQHVERIVGLELDTLVARAARSGYRLEATPAALSRLAELGYEPRYGVRSLKRCLLEQVEDPLARMVVEGRIAHGGTVMVGCTEDGRIELQCVPADTPPASPDESRLVLPIVTESRPGFPILAEPA